jgi:putative membrane protein insertion efficiency factor
MKSKFFGSFFQERTASFLIFLVHTYRLLLRPLLPPACRFEPSCSTYAIEALRTHGAVHGSALAAWRVARCNPWGGCGYDPVPPCNCRHAVLPRGHAKAN